MTTLPRPTLGAPSVGDLHTRAVDIELTDAEVMPIPATSYRIRTEGHFRPSKLRLFWRGAPAQLASVDLTGFELNKNGQVNARYITHRHRYLLQDSEWDRRVGWVNTNQRLADDTPDWIRELIDQHAPDWPALTTPTTAEEN